MITMNELVDLRMQQQLAQEILYRQQIMQRIPDPFAAMMPTMHLPAHMLMPQHPPLPGVEAKLENNDLWQQFHKIGTEMIITKCGRRMFPSMRVSLKGLDEESQYCVLIEMVPIGDCRYKFSGSQWIPAGGAEPQSPQRMYLHPDSPATGAHWQAQPILFNKVKLTNNTLDNNGHIVLASMHKYQPRIHVIRTNDLAQIPWAAQQGFVFPETEFVAVTAYQNDRITKLKIDNNPFAKGFRETGQSKCKRKMSVSPGLCDDQQHSNLNSSSSQHTDDDQSSVASSQDSPLAKRHCSSSSMMSMMRDERNLQFLDRCYMNSNLTDYTAQQSNIYPSAAAAAAMFMATTNTLPPAYVDALYMATPSASQAHNMLAAQQALRAQQQHHDHIRNQYLINNNEDCLSSADDNDDCDRNPELFVDVVSTSSEESAEIGHQLSTPTSPPPPQSRITTISPTLSPTSVSSVCTTSSASSSSFTLNGKRSSFSISSILANNSSRNPALIA